MDTIKIEKKNVLMIAHRGVSGLETENTKKEIENLTSTIKENEE